MGIEFKFVSRTPKGENQISYSSLDKKSMEENLVIINTTPLGMYGDMEAKTQYSVRILWG